MLATVPARLGAPSLRYRRESAAGAV